jgi:TonB family protein
MVGAAQPPTNLLPRGIIARLMQPSPQPALPTQNPARTDTRFGALSMNVAWESRREIFRSSLRAFFTGPRAPKGEAISGGDHLRVEWVDDKIPGRAFTASSLWHVAAVGLLLLPIWGFLPSMQPKIAPTQVVLTWDAAQDLPQISLPAPAPKPKLAAPPRAEIPDPAPDPERGADAFHPRQTILSIPVRITHPRQTLIQPNAPATPPKLEPQLPNMVQWAATSPQPQPQMVFTAKVAAPKVKSRDVQDVAAPDIVNQEKTPGPLNIASAPVLNPAPRMALSSMSAAVAQQRPVRTQNTAAPELAPETSSGDASLRRVIALSTAPAPPAPVAALPQGNLAARISISPDGAKPGTPGGADRPGGAGAGSQGASVSAGGSKASGAGSNSLPAAVSISGGNRNGAGGKFNLDPKLSLPSRPDAMNSLRKGPSVTGNIDPSISPDKILSGKEVYTMHIDMPNLTSASGSWVLNFAQLDERVARSSQPQARLAAPVLERKVDPKYPPAFIKANVEGQVILYAIIRKDGSVDSIQRVRGLEPQLDQNAMQAFAQWKFSPATRDGAPVDVEAVVFIPFRFRGPAN